MALELEVTAVHGRPGPLRRLLLTCRLRWHKGSPAFLLGLEGNLLWGDDVVAAGARAEDLQFIGGNPALLERGGHYYSATLGAPMTTEALRFIEEQRNGGDVSLKLDYRYGWQEVVRSGQPGVRQGGDAREMLLGGAVNWVRADSSVRIPRSDWVTLLQQFRWAEVELFEVAVLPLVEDPDLQQALRLVREARDVMMSGDWPGVLARCFRAFESAAKYQAQGDDKPGGFKRLLERSLLEPADRGDRMDAIIGALNKYSQLGRHEVYPALQVSREEAHLVLASTVAVFALISRGLAGSKRA